MELKRLTMQEPIGLLDLLKWIWFGLMFDLPEWRVRWGGLTPLHSISAKNLVWGVDFDPPRQVPAASGQKMGVQKNSARLARKLFVAPLSFQLY